MSFQEALEEFAESLKTTYSTVSVSNAQLDDQLKPPTVTLLDRVGGVIGSEVIANTEAYLAELGARPDVAVSVDGAVTGHIELKAPGKGAQPRKLKGKHDADQWKKFRNHPNLVYSDGNEWALYRNGERHGKLVRLSGDATSEGGKAISDDDARGLELLLRDFSGC